MKKLFILPLLIASLFGLTSKVDSSNILEISGKVAMYGNEPHTYLAIKSSDNTLYKIQNPKEFNLFNMQNQNIKVKAVLLSKKAGPGFPATIKVLKLEK